MVHPLQTYLQIRRARPVRNLFRRFLPSVLSLGKTDGTSAPRRHLMASEGGIDGRVHPRVVSKCRKTTPNSWSTVSQTPSEFKTISDDIGI